MQKKMELKIRNNTVNFKQKKKQKMMFKSALKSSVKED